MSNSTNFQEYLPLTEATFFIMLTLSPAPKHGYAIMKDTAALSNGRVQLSTSTLYGALKRLLMRDWIERVDDDGVENGRIRKAYSLTHLGRRILNAEIARMEALVIAAKQSTAGAQA
ncbi:MAG: PadR family transcriptional regulator [Chloroflexi bacterium]|nr:PadR family transcriptional regulator [Chloroflexota bacterium]